jgi:hypothetical protein
VTVTDGGDLSEVCYSGQAGNGAFAVSEDGMTLPFVVPPLPIGGPYNLVFTTQSPPSVVTLPAVLTVIHRTFAAGLFSIRAHAPPPRNVGPYSLGDSD